MVESVETRLLRIIGEQVTIEGMNKALTGECIDSLFVRVHDDMIASSLSK